MRFRAALVRIHVRPIIIIHISFHVVLMRTITGNSHLLNVIICVVVSFGLHPIPRSIPLWITGTGKRIQIHNICILTTPHFDSDYGTSIVMQPFILTVIVINRDRDDESPCRLIK